MNRNSLLLIFAIILIINKCYTTKISLSSDEDEEDINIDEKEDSKDKTGRKLDNNNLKIIYEITRNSIKSSGFFSETVDEWISFVAILLDALYSLIIGIILLIKKFKK